MAYIRTPIAPQSHPTMKVSAILKGRKDSDGRQSVYIRVNEGHKRTFKVTRVRILPEHFENGQVVKHPQSKLLNEIIRKEILSMEVKAWKGVEKKTPDYDFYDYAKRCLHTWKQTKVKKDQTLRQLSYELNKLKRYKASFKLSEIDVPLLRGLHQHCLIEEDNINNTAWKTFKHFSTFVNQAVEDGLLPLNPVKKYKDRPKYKAPKKDYLTKDDLTQVEKFAKATTPARRFATLWFLIGCYTGLSYGEMHTFDKKKHLKSGRLIMERGKTGETVSLPFTGKIKDLFEQVEYKPLHLQNQPYNRVLKTIAKGCELDINMTAHISRHTAAMQLANAGVSIEVTAKILGHTNTKHTSQYYKISNQRIDKEIEKIF